MSKKRRLYVSSNRLSRVGLPESTPTSVVDSDVEPTLLSWVTFYRGIIRTVQSRPTAERYTIEVSRQIHRSTESSTKGGGQLSRFFGSTFHVTEDTELEFQCVKTEEDNHWVWLGRSVSSPGTFPFLVEPSTDSVSGT